MTTQLAAIFMAVTNAFSLPPGLLSAICKVESNYVVDAINIDDGTDNSVGVCQLHLSTARWMGYRGSERELHRNPHVNSYYAGKYLAHLLSRYDGHVLRAISGYNAGSYHVDEQGVVRNQQYVTKVVIAWETLRSNSNVRANTKEVRQIHTKDRDVGESMWDKDYQKRQARRRLLSR